MFAAAEVLSKSGMQSYRRLICVANQVFDVSHSKHFAAGVFTNMKVDHPRVQYVDSWAHQMLTLVLWSARPYLFDWACLREPT